MLGQAHPAEEVSTVSAHRLPQALLADGADALLPVFVPQRQHGPHATLPTFCLRASCRLSREDGPARRAQSWSSLEDTAYAHSFGQWLSVLSGAQHGAYTTVLHKMQQYLMGYHMHPLVFLHLQNLKSLFSFHTPGGSR